MEKKARTACPRGPGLKPGTYRVLGDGPQFRQVFRQVSLSVAIDRVGRLRNTTCGMFWRFLAVRVNRELNTVYAQ